MMCSELPWKLAMAEIELAILIIAICWFASAAVNEWINSRL